MPNSPAYSIIAAEFNKSLIDTMIEVALETFHTHGLRLARVVRVPGCYEIPLVASTELENPGVAGAVVLGYIERGETLHGEVMGHVVSAALIAMQLRMKKPIGIGIIGPGATPEQAMARHADSARAAVKALKQVVDLL